MKAFRPGRTSLGGILLVAFAMSCSSKTAEKAVDPVAADTPRADALSTIDTTQTTAVIIKAVTEEAAPSIPLSENEEKIAMDHWTDGNLFRPMLIVFSRERVVSFLPYISEGEFDRQDGEWFLKSDTLTIVMENDTASYKVNSFIEKSMDMTLVGGNKNLFGQDHGTLYRDNEKELYLVADIIGSWAAGDGFKFTDEKNFTYYDPLCSLDFPGTWSLDGDVIKLNFTGETCNDKTYERRYRIVNLSDHWLILYSREKGNALARYRQDS